ncbi:hypothetical protein GF314_16175 [bacterium]|nr:hypothetical protein [bacterium]
MRRGRACRAWLLGILATVAVTAGAQPELTYEEYRSIARSSIQLLHCAMYEPLDGEVGMMMVLADRFGKLNAYRLLPGNQRERVWSSRNLDGAAEEVLIADLEGDGLEDHIVCRTRRRIYVFRLEDFFNSFESQPNDYTDIRAFAIGNVDSDPAAEIVINADDKLHYVDGLSFTREFTSLNDYEATRMRVGDVTGDNVADIVLNTGQVIEASTGEIIWEDEVFGSRLELFDLDGDGVLEVMTESDGLPFRVWDVDFKQEKRF